ncbi:hypothetical protein BJX99DRAFT_253448 [Aspergillus californicus]
MFFRGPARTQPAQVETDDVYPVHMLDGSKTFRDIVIVWTMCFNDVLDADKLHVSLSRLLEIGDWRKLGGRLRFKENGELEIHVPRSFTKDRPAISYSHQALSVNIEDHELAKTLPKATSNTSIHAGPQHIRPLAVPDGAPVTLADYIYDDKPQLSLFVTSFNNATFVSLSWPHTVMDVMGQKAILHAWSLVLANRESEVPPLLGARDDALCAAADASADTPTQKNEESKLAQKQLKGWAMLKFGLLFAWDMFWNPVVEARTICLPEKAMAELRRQAQEDLQVQGGGEEPPFVSDGDLLTAWVVRGVASSLPQPRPVTVLHAVNARFRLQSLIRASGSYVQNMAVVAFAFFSSEVASGSLGPIALENRHHLLEQSSEAQVLAFIRQMGWEETKAGRDSPLLYGDSDALLMVLTNWTKADIFRITDFSPAIVRAGEISEERRNPPGTMVFQYAQSMRESSMMRNVVIVLGKDHAGNYWLVGNLLPAAWDRFEECVGRM